MLRRICRCDSVLLTASRGAASSSRNGSVRKPISKRLSKRADAFEASKQREGNERNWTDRAEVQRELNVEMHFQKAMEHIKGVPASPSSEQDVRDQRIVEENKLFHVDGYKKVTGEERPPRTFFDEGGVDIRGAPERRHNQRATGHDDVLQLSGVSPKKHSIAVNSGKSLASPSDTTLVEEDDFADTPVQLTDMLRERLMELKAEKISGDRNDTFLPKRLALQSDEEVAATGMHTAPQVLAAKSTTTPKKLSSVTLQDVASGYSAQQDDEVSIRKAVAESLLSSADDLLPGSSSYDPFAAESVTKVIGRSGFGTDATEASEADEQPDRRGKPFPSGDGGVLLLRTLQRSSLCSRRESIELIASGEVTVDGIVERNPFRCVVASNDIKIKGHPQRLRFAPPRLWVYHKPSNVIVSRSDPVGRTLMTKHAMILGFDHLIPVGSLPMRSHGLLLLTNDGELARFLTHPSALIQQSYQFRVKPAIDPILAHKLNTEGVRINGVVHRNIEFHVNHARMSRFHVKVKVRGETIPAHQLMNHLGRTVTRGGRVSFGPYVLHGLAPGGIRQVTVPPYYMKHVASIWKPFVERDWPFYRRQRVMKLKKLAKFRELHAKELEELDAFTFEEIQDALRFEHGELDQEARRIAQVLEHQPHVDESHIQVFPPASFQAEYGNGAEVSEGSILAEDAFVDDITKV